MEIVNVIVINRISLQIDNLISFVIVESQLKQDVVEQAENEYFKLCMNYGALEDDKDYYCDEGYYTAGEVEVQIIWSYEVVNQ